MKEANKEEKPAQRSNKTVPRSRATDSTTWIPKTELGKKVKDGSITDIDEAVSSASPIMEAEIVDMLMPDMKTELLLVGQSKGKFGGGQRRVFKQTQKKTREGNKPSFGTFCIVGNENGFIGCGVGKAKETVPAREKAIRKAKLNIFKIARGCGSWECGCGNPHSIPYKVHGKCGSVEISLLPAPKGTGLCIESECAKILQLCGIKDIWSKTKGHTKTKFNLIYACIEALKQLNQVKSNEMHTKDLGIIKGKLVEEKNE
ncbi:30S ribosomal protein S5 [Candidatus Woesearchaeota archaeon]|nr:30S ribosomal protein S5 [Candidatus Woesearchaeota archaeon]